MTKKQRSKSVLLPLVEAGDVIPDDLVPKGCPACLVYFADFITSVQDLSREDRGDYMMLLWHQGNRGSLPVDKASIDRLAGGNVSNAVMARFSVMRTAGGDRLVNKRLLVECERYEARAKQLAEMSPMGVKARSKSNSNGQPHGEPYGQPHGEPYGQPHGEPNGNHTVNRTVNQMVTNLNLNPNKEGSNNIGGPSHVEVKDSPPPQSPPQEIEPPPGFPRSEDEAIASAEMINIDRETAYREYHKAVSRGYLDAKGNLVRNWHSLLKIAQSYAQEHKERNGRNGYHRETIGTSTPSGAAF